MTPDATAQAVTTHATRGAGTIRVGEGAYRALNRHRGLVVLSAAAIALLLVLSRTSWFWADDWTFIRTRSLADPASWFLPHIQHFVLLHAAVYSVLLAVFGTTTYLPFLLVLWAAHLAFVAGVYTLIDRHVGRGPALTAAAILLLSGHAALNLLWAFQMGPIASAALAIWALLIVRDRPGIAAVLLAFAVMTDAFALFFVPAIVVYGWSRRALAVAAVPVVIYAIWYGLARGAMPHYGDPLTFQGVVDWIPAGVAASAAVVTGLGGLGTVLLIVALVLLPVRVPGDRRAAVVGIVGLVTEYGILGLTRQGVSAPTHGQYLYFGAAFLLPVFASAWPAIPRLGRPAVAVLACVAVSFGFLALIAWSSEWPGIMAATDQFCRACP